MLRDEWLLNGKTNMSWLWLEWGATVTAQDKKQGMERNKVWERIPVPLEAAVEQKLNMRPAETLKTQPPQHHTFCQSSPGAEPGVWGQDQKTGSIPGYSTAWRHCYATYKSVLVSTVFQNLANELEKSSMHEKLVLIWAHFYLQRRFKRFYCLKNPEKN